jgi:hypothetical protein
MLDVTVIILLLYSRRSISPLQRSANLSDTEWVAS